MQVSGTYDRTIYRDEKTASTIFSIKLAHPIREQNRYGCIVCTGKIMAYPKGMPLIVEGELSENEYGKQIAVKHIREYTWDSVSAVNFLSSGNFDGVGYSAAKELVDKCGYDIFSIAGRADAVEFIRRRVRRFGRETAKHLCEKLVEIVKQRELFEYVFSFGASWVSFERLNKRYGNKAVDELKKEPYSIGMECGLGFMLCDEIAKQEGMHPLSCERVQAVIKAAMWRLASDGHVYAPINEVLRAVSQVVKSSAFTTEIPASMTISILEKHPDIVLERIDTLYVYLKILYEAETETAREVHRLMNSKNVLPFDEGLIQYAEEKCGMRFEFEQRESFNLLRQTGIAIVTGGPGTGKSTCVSGLLAAYEKMKPSGIIRLCAPTGRAAQRLAETTGREAVTIHRLLSINPEYGLKRENVAMLDADLLIVDETSMISATMVHLLLSSVKSGALVLFVGDINQLPSVEAGDVLHDLIFSEMIPVCHLRRVHRQAAGSPIIRNAELINAGFYDLDEEERFVVESVDNPAGIADKTLEYIKSIYNPKRPFETQVLSPVYRGESGVTNLNALLQMVLNPKVDGIDLHFGGKRFRRNDKVIFLANNYAEGYCNGDIGIVVDVGEAFMTVQLGERQLCLTSQMLDDVDLAYCISIHKGQGSEFKNVIMALPNVQNLSKNLLYTGVTRAKERIILLTQHGAVYTAVENDCIGKRHSRLIERIAVGEFEERKDVAA